jgi:hypothetical protein
MLSAAIPILSRVYPGRVSWDILSRPWRDYSCSHVLPRTYVLGYSQPSLRDLILNPRFSRRHFKPMSGACRNVRNKLTKYPGRNRRDGKQRSHAK